jgi:predicted metal-dependent HD superfamily phosphohydrolase
MKKEIDLGSMKEKWYLLFGRNVAKEQPTLDSLFGGIVKKYSEPHRRYHTLAHVEEGLSLFEKFSGIAHNHFHVKYAYWMHDIVYDPKSDKNEELSALFAREALKIILSEVPICKTVDQEEVDAAINYNCGLVTNLILATKHDSKQTDPDCQLICDIDLYRLTGDNLKEDIADIRFEYSHLSDEQWVRGRADFLTSLYQRGYVFQTSTFKEAFEKKAMANVVEQAKKFTEMSLKYDRKLSWPKVFSI